jgi:hypothetical protein
MSNQKEKIDLIIMYNDCLKRLEYAFVCKNKEEIEYFKFVIKNLKAKIDQSSDE